MRKEIMIKDIKTEKLIKFIWNDIKKYNTSIKALKKAEQENKIIIYWELSK